MVSFKFFPCQPLLPWQRILGQKLTTTRPSWKIIACCFHLHAYFRAQAMQWCRVNFSPEDPCCHGNQPFLFKDKIGCRLTGASNAETQLLGCIAWQWDRIPRSTKRISSSLRNRWLCNVLDVIEVWYWQASTETWVMHRWNYWEWNRCHMFTVLAEVMATLREISSRHLIVQSLQVCPCY